MDSAVVPDDIEHTSDEQETFQHLEPLINKIPKESERKNAEYKVKATLMDISLLKNYLLDINARRWSFVQLAVAGHVSREHPWANVSALPFTCKSQFSCAFFILHSGGIDLIEQF
uniref:AlNc14C2G284 protein n=1 Tax=Albugo laibachii Nc14 TaxID=890382 RepID=F0VZE6_9STRA|nr:AlNc14C2G284 [Albugo laibachii Nc14]|eukprot:CCA14176.1 AlNc14C2G284 [Albugo laibachii Nc14]